MTELEYEQEAALRSTLTNMQTYLKQLRVNLAKARCLVDEQRENPEATVSELQGQLREIHRAVEKLV